MNDQYAQIDFPFGHGAFLKAKSDGFPFKGEILSWKSGL
jgi:hypothetical protein